MNGEKISVCVLTYNHEALIQSTLATVLDQTLDGFEVIVSDDCSTDGTYARILEMAEKDPRIRPVQTPHNMGMPGNANFAVSLSERPYIALLHHDDLYRRDLLEKWLAVVETHPDATFVFNAYGVEGSDFVYSVEVPPGRVDGRWLLDTFLLPGWGCPVRGTAMIRRSEWEAVGGMREQFGLLSDIDMWMRLAMRGSVGYVDEPVITVREQRPDDYPDTYKGNALGAFWKRQRFLYEIHAANRLAHYDLGTVGGRLAWWRFRLRLSRETAKWLAYAVVRRKPVLISTSADGATAYDLPPLRLIRALLQAAVGGRETRRA
ncbi:glycosyltransferase involved in cell wall biosynthesis [Amorphus suaedae]